MPPRYCDAVQAWMFDAIRSGGVAQQELDRIGDDQGRERVGEILLQLLERLPNLRDSIVSPDMVDGLTKANPRAPKG